MRKASKDTTSGGEVSGEDIGKDETIRRLKVLSLSQTAFLKDYIGKRLKVAHTLVTSALIALKNEGASSELINSLAELDLDSLTTVDVKSAQLMMHEEMALLRTAIEEGRIAGSVPPSSSSSTKSTTVPDTASKETILKLETENVNLRGLLKELKEELMVVGKGPFNGGASSDQKMSEQKLSDLNVQLSELKVTSSDKEAKLKATLAELNELKASLSDKDVKLKKTFEELEGSRASLSALEKEMSSLRATQSSLQHGTTASEHEIANLKAVVVNLTSKLEKSQKSSQEASEALKKQLQEADERVKAITTTNETEKEEMMGAMAQELEETELKHATELAAITKENKKLSKSLSKYKSTSKIFSTGLLPVKNNIASLSLAQKKLSSTIREEMQVTLKNVSSHFGSSLMRKLKQNDNKVSEITIKWKKEMTERKRLHNVIQELKGNIRVFMRCRPPSQREIEQFGGAESVCVSVSGENEVKVFNEKGREKTWEFDQIFHIDSNQNEVYNEVSDLIISVLDGFNVCIFAYGQTGSGKTYTMTGGDSVDSQGVNIRALGDLFDKVNSRTSEWHDTVSVSVLEVYNEAINDLLDASKQEKLEVKQGLKGNHVPGLTQVPVTSLAEVTKLLEVSDKNRSQACTNMNEHSSRSHMMLTVNISSEHRETHVISRGKLNLVDLAGSERLDKSGATGVALKEAQNINKSLSALGDVIAARASKQGHIPFPRVRSVELGKASKNVTTAGSGTGTDGSKPTLQKRASAASLHR